MIINLALPGFVPVVTGVGQCIADALAQTPAGAPDRICLLVPTAQIPWDNCQCGQMAQAIRSIYGSDAFPQSMTGKSWVRCGPHLWVAKVVVSVTRCVPTMDEEGRPPSCDDSLGAAVTLANDIIAVRQAIACCLDSMLHEMPPTVASWMIAESNTVGEQGGCAGSETEYYVGMRGCACGG